MKILEVELKAAWLDGYQAAIIALLEVKQVMPLMAATIDRLATLLQDVKPDPKGS